MALKLLIGHKCQRGKDTAADYIISKYGGIKLKFADPLYQICSGAQSAMGRPVKKDPPLMQATADMLRGAWGEDCFAQHARDRVDRIYEESTEPVNIIFSDFRHLVEHAAFPEFITICIHRDIETTDRDPTHSSETELDNFPFDFEIHNNQLDDLYKLIDETIAIIRAREPGQ